MGPDHSSQPSFLNRTRERLMRAVKMHSTPTTQTDLAKVIEQASHDDIINEDTEDMIRGVLDITKHRLDDIMIPRSQIVDIDLECTLREAISIIKEHGHSRYPVSLADKDHIVGILLTKDLLPLCLEQANLEKKIKEFSTIFHKPVIVPESKRVDMMLKDFQQDRFHMSIVIDEYGGVCGLVSIEDIIELIVGEITDEYEKVDSGKEQISKTGDNSYIVKGSMLLEDFEEYFKEQLPKVDVDTVAGFVIHSLGHLPQKDESITIKNFIFKVINAKHHKVNTIHVTYTPPKDE